MKIKYSILSGLAFALIVFFYLAFTAKMDIAIVVSVFILLVSPFLFYIKMFSKMDTVEFNKVEKSLIIHSGRASHFKNGITAGGTLYLLSDRLIFQTNMSSFLYRHEEILFLNQIEKVEFIKTMGLLNNGLIIKLRDNSMHQFVVSNREIWKAQIEKLEHALTLA